LGTDVLASPNSQLENLKGKLAIGQIGGLNNQTGQLERNHDVQVDQPLTVRWQGGQLALAMSGRLTNGFRLRTELQEDGAVFSTASEVEVLAHLIARASKSTFVNRLVEALWSVHGSYCLTVCTEDLLIAVRDPVGFRPLMLGEMGGAIIISSEDTVLRNFECKRIREIEPGEMVIVDKRGLQIVRPFLQRPRAACVEEIVQLARNDARVFQRDVYSVRVALGASLARHQPCAQGTVAVGLPGAGVPVALGYAQELGLPYHRGLEAVSATAGQDPRYISGIHREANRNRYRANRAVVTDQNVVLAVPVLVTGQTVRSVIKTLRHAGAATVHVRIASPPVRYSNPYGIAMPTSEELACRQKQGLDSLTGWLGADSIGFLSLEHFRGVINVPGQPGGWCETIYTGELPIPTEEDDSQLEMFGSSGGAEGGSSPERDETIAVPTTPVAMMGSGGPILGKATTLNSLPTAQGGDQTVKA